MRELMWTEESEDHIWERHHVLPGEVEEVVNTRPRFVRKGRDGVEELFGQTDAGRYLWVLLGPALDGREYVVTARDMEDDEKRLYRERAR